MSLTCVSRLQITEHVVNWALFEATPPNDHHFSFPLWTVMAEARAWNITERKRVVLTIKDKLKICHSLRKGRSMASLAVEFIHTFQLSEHPRSQPVRISDILLYLLSGSELHVAHILASSLHSIYSPPFAPSFLDMVHFCVNILEEEFFVSFSCCFHEDQLSFLPTCQKCL